MGRRRGVPALHRHAKLLHRWTMPETPASPADTLDRIDRALALIEDRLRPIKTRLAEADADKAALTALQQEVEGAIGDLDGLIAQQGGSAAHG